MKVIVKQHSHVFGSWVTAKLGRPSLPPAEEEEEEEEEEKEEKEKEKEEEEEEEEVSTGRGEDFMMNMC